MNSRDRILRLNPGILDLSNKWKVFEGFWGDNDRFEQSNKEPRI